MSDPKDGGNPPQVFVCQRCGKKFQRKIYPSRHNQTVYCSKACQLNAPPRDYICKACGKTFTRNHYPSRQEPQYCSVRCAREVDPKVLICEQCNKLYQKKIPPSQKIPRYCSQECFKLADARKPKTCQLCDKSFIGQNDYYCSLECTRLAKRKYTPVEEERILNLYQELGIHRTSKLLEIPKRDVYTIGRRYKVEAPPESKWDVFRDNPTALEAELFKHLETLNVAYKSQLQIGRYIVDALIDDHLIIEADGDYWHGHPRFEPLTARQRKQRGQDRARDTYFSERGYTVERVWESDMCLEAVASILRRHGIID